MIRQLKKELGEQYALPKAKNSKMGQTSRSETIISDIEGRIKRIRANNKGKTGM